MKTDTQGKCQVTMRTDGTDGAASQGTSKTDGHDQRLRRGKKGFDPESQREQRPADTLTSGG